MLKRAAVVLVGAALIVGGPTFASAKSKAHHHKKHTYAFTITTRSVAVSSTGNPPVSGSQLTAGVLDGTIGPKAVHGASRAVANYTSAGKATVTGTNFSAPGSVNFTMTLSGSVDANGNITFTGSGTITGGTGQTKGAKGTFTISGEQPKGSQVTTATAKGKITF